MLLDFDCSQGARVPERSTAWADTKYVHALVGLVSLSQTFAANTAVPRSRDLDRPVAEILTDGAVTGSFPWLLAIRSLIEIDTKLPIENCRSLHTINVIFL